MSTPDYSHRCNACTRPLGLCVCQPASDADLDRWAMVQAFRRECYPEAFSPFMLTHVVAGQQTVSLA